MRPSVHPASGFRIRILPIEQLVPAAYNPRRALKPTCKAYRRLEKSLREFGLVEPLVWNERTGHVVGGHARLSILKAMGVPEVPVSVVNLSDAKEKALNVILNNQDAQGRYDPTRLADLLDELDDLPELELTGFAPDELSPLRLVPVADLPPLEEIGDSVTVTLQMTEEVFGNVGPRLDALVRKYDLTSHVRRN